jgi:hypothetical protein
MKIVFAVLLVLIFAACDNLAGNDDGSNGTGDEGADAEDFPGIVEELITRFNVADADKWNAALSAIAGGGNNKNYVITLTGSFNIPTVDSSTYTFGSVTGITVSLRGKKTLRPDSNGHLLRTGAGQTLVLRESLLQGKAGNVSSLVDVPAGSSFKMYGGEIFDNTASGKPGGGVSVGGKFEMYGGKIFDNTAGSGGGVFVDGGSFTMTSGEISDNTAVDYGGGVRVAEGGSFTLSGGNISGNIVERGGGVHVNGGIFTMEGGEISGNKALSTGGGVYAYNPHFTLKSGKISGNTADNHGGGVRTFGDFIMKGGLISGNTAHNGGGVMADNYTGGSGSFTMEGGEISGNTSGSYEGGGVYVSGSFSKTGSGAVVYGADAANSLKNTAGQGDTWGHAVFYRQDIDDSTRYDYYHDATLDAGNNISTNAPLPANSNDSLNNWTKR